MSVQTGDTPQNPQNPQSPNTSMNDAITRARLQQTQSQPAPGYQGAPQGAQAQAERIVPPNRGGSTRPPIMDINQTLSRFVSRRSTGESVRQFKEAIEKDLEETFKSPDQRGLYRLYVMEAAAQNIAMSTLLMTYAVNHNGVEHHGVYQMVVENSGVGSLPSRQINIGTQPIQIDLVPGDTVNAELWDRINTFLRETTGRQIELHDAGALVLPSTLSPTDKEHIHRVVYNATQALFTVIDNEVTGSQVALSIGMTQGAKLTADIDYNPLAVDDAVGSPVRSNLSVALRASFGNQGQSIHENVLKLARVDAYVEPVYQAPQQAGFGMAPDFRRYIPRVVFTRMDSEIDSITLESQLLALITGTILGRQMAWGGAFRARHTGTDVNLRDIGAIGYEVNLTGDPNAISDRIDTRPEVFSTVELAQLLNTTFYTDRVIYSMDIAETGELSWLDQTFLAAANNDPGAVMAVTQAADRLTNGAFSRLWQPHMQIAIDDRNRIQLGYYTDGAGNKRDLREFDYLAVLNLFGGKDQQIALDWAATNDDQATPIEIRLDRRARILKDIVDAKITGYARRITWTTDFIVTLEQAAELAGLQILPSNITQDFIGSQGRAQYSAAAVAVPSSVGANVFAYGGSPYGGFRGGMQQPYLGRFTR